MIKHNCTLQDWQNFDIFYVVSKDSELIKLYSSNIKGGI